MHSGCRRCRCVAAACHTWKLKVEKSVIISVVGLELVSGEVDLKTGSKISIRVHSLEGGQTSESGGGGIRIDDSQCGG